MKNQLIVSAVLFGLSATAMAVDPAALLNGNTTQHSKLDELKVVQQEYQDLIRAQSRDEANIKRLEYQLARAEKKLTKAQASLNQAQFNRNKLQTELTWTREIHQTQQKELQRVGDRLNQAWQAIYGTSNYRMANTK